MTKTTISIKLDFSTLETAMEKVKAAKSAMTKAEAAFELKKLMDSEDYLKAETSNAHQE